MDHSAVGVKSVAVAGGVRVRGKPCEERIERLWGEGMGIDVYQLDYVKRCKRREELSERGL